MIVSFFGHRRIYNGEELRARLNDCVLHLIESGASEFLLGDYGEFDRLCATALQKQRANHPQIRLVYIQPYLDRAPEQNYFDEVVYPPLESVPKRYAIIRRNEWMISKSDIVVVYSRVSYGGAAAALAYAKRKKKAVICL